MAESMVIAWPVGVDWVKSDMKLRLDMRVLRPQMHVADLRVANALPAEFWQNVPRETGV